MPYCRLFYHLVWATKNREPLLAVEVEAVVYDLLRAKAVGLGAALYALNGTVDHVHMMVAIPPALAVAEFVGQVKGVSSAKYNKSGRAAVLYWQADYDAFSFDGKRLPHIISYVECQKEHHAQSNTIPTLERTAGDDATPLRLTDRTATRLSSSPVHGASFDSLTVNGQAGHRQENLSCAIVPFPVHHSSCP
jgi:putative transposase